MKTPKKNRSWIRPTVAGFFFLCSGLVLALSFYLVPDPHGFGTHRQLGLSSCTFMTLMNYPCPMCGMTTSFALMSRFQILRALETQPFGVFLYFINLGIMILAVMSLLKKKKYVEVLSWMVLNENTILRTMFLGLLGGWVYKMVIFKSGS